MTVSANALPQLSPTLATEGSIPASAWRSEHLIDRYLPAIVREIVPSPWIFGWGWPVFGTAAFLSTLASAALHRRFSNRMIWSVSQIVMALGLLLPVVFPHILSIVAAGLCVGATFMVITIAGLTTYTCP